MDEGVSWIALFRYLKAEPWNFSIDEILGMTLWQVNVFCLPENMVHLKFDGDDSASQADEYQAVVKERDGRFLQMLIG